MVPERPTTCYGCDKQDLVLYEHNGKYFCADCYQWRYGTFPEIGERQ